jgi:hypothetical protein
MKHRMTIQCTETDNALMWERWRKKSQSLQAIAQLFDRNHYTVLGLRL